MKPFIMLLCAIIGFGMVCEGQKLPCCSNYCDDVYSLCQKDDDLNYVNMEFVYYDGGVVAIGDKLLKERFVSTEDGTKIKCKVGSERSSYCEDVINTFVNKEAFEGIIPNYQGSEDFCQFLDEKTDNLLQCSNETALVTDCFCRKGNITSDIEIFNLNDNTYRKFLEKKIIPVGVTRKISQPKLVTDDFDDGEFSFGKRDVLSEESTDETADANVFVTLEVNLLKFTFSDQAAHTIIIRKEDWSTIETTDVLTFSLTLPRTATIISGPITYEVYHDNQLIKKGTLNYYAAYLCRDEGCTVCYDAIMNWSCLSSYQQAFLILLFILIGAMIILIFKILIDYKVFYCLCFPFTALWWCCCSVKNSPFVKDVGKAKHYAVNVKNYFVPTDVLPVKSPESSPIVEHIKSGQAQDPDELKDIAERTARLVDLIEKANSRERKATRERKLKKKSKDYENDDFSEESLSSSNEDLSYEKEKYPSRRGGGSKLSKISVFTLLCCFSFSLTEACTTGVFIPTTFSTCTRFNLTTEVCTSTFSLTATIPYPGASTCLYLKTPDNQILAELSFEYLEMRATLGVITEYYTSSWSANSQSNKRCPKTENCPKNCAAVNDNQIRNAYGELTDSVTTTFPGRVRCRSSCGCASCGCFYCQDGCVFSGIGLYGKGDIAQVKSIQSMTYSPSLTISMKDSNGYKNMSVINSGQCSTFGQDYKVCIIGSLQGDTTIFGQDKIVEVGGKSYFVGASNRGFPVSNTIGDIQGVSPSSFSGTHNFIYAPNLWTISEEETRDNYNLESPGLDRVSSGKLIPTIIGGNLWMKQPISNQYYSSLTSPGALLFTFESTRNVSFTRVLNIVCPKGSLVTASGCYNCNKGSSAIIKLKSECLGGSVYIKTLDETITIQNLALTITTTESEYNVRFLTNKANVDFEMIVEGSGSTIKIPIKFTAVSDVTLPDNQGGNPTDIKAKKNENDIGWFDDAGSFFHKLGDWFDSIFDGVAKWYDYLIFAGFIILSVIIIAVCIKVLKTVLTPVYNKARVRANESKLIMKLQDLYKKKTNVKIQ